MANLVELVKQASAEERDASMPCDILFGTVISASPIEINVEQKMTLTASQLILSTLVQEFDVDMTVDHNTENTTFPGSHTHTCPDGTTNGGNLVTTHLHAYRGRKTFTVHLGLKAGEKVMLIRAQGGQKFIVLDRVR